MKISIIIITSNVEHIITTCLNTISKYNLYQIICIDNLSKDKTLSVIKNKFPKITLVRNIKNVGFAKATNQGANIAKGEYLLFLNPDTIVKPNAIKKMVEFLKSKKDASVVGCKTLNADGSLQPSCGNFPTIINIILDRIPLINKIIKTELIRQKEYYEKEQSPDWISGAFFLVRKTVFEKLGGFDEKYFLYVEDVDFCYRAKQAGYKIYYNPKAEIVHFDMGKLNERKGFKAKQMRLGFTIFFTNYRSKPYVSLWQLILKIEYVIKSIKKLLTTKILSIIAIVSLILFMFVYYNYEQKFQYYFKKFMSKNIIFSYEEKFKDVKKFLPSKGVIGYASDIDNNTIINSIGINEYYLIQYILSPLIIVNSTDPNIIISYSHNLNKKTFLKNEKYKILKDFHNGILLIGK